MSRNIDTFFSEKFGFHLKFHYILYMMVEKFWHRVRKQIKAHKISVVKFTEYIRVPRSTFYNWIRLDIIPDVITAYNIATALGVSLEYLITGEGRKAEKLRMEELEIRKNTEAQVKKLVFNLQNEVLKF